MILKLDSFTDSYAVVTTTKTTTTTTNILRPFFPLLWDLAFCSLLYFVYQSKQHTRISIYQSFVMHESLF